MNRQRPEKIRVYYLDRPLTPVEVDSVVEYLGCPIDQVRIAHILPAPDAERGYSDRPLADEEMVEPLLAKAGIRRVQGQQVGLVVPKEQHWYLALARAIFHQTGFHPYLIQPTDQREPIGNPGGLRVIDSHGLMGLKEGRRNAGPPRPGP